MWGILSIGLLLFVLYHYRPRISNKASEFKDALLWSEWGKRFAIGHVIVIIWLIYFSEVIRALRDSQVNTVFDVLLILFKVPAFTGTRMPDAISIMFFICLIFLPLLFTWLIHKNLVKPLDEDKIPSRKNSRFTFGTGLLFLLLLATPIIAIFLRHGISVIQSFLQALFLIIPLFYGMLMASVFSVGIAKHKFVVIEYTDDVSLKHAPTFDFSLDRGDKKKGEVMRTIYNKIRKARSGA